MTIATLFWLWLGACYLIWLLTRAPLQPDDPIDDLGAVDVQSPEFQVALKNASWLDRPVANVVLSRRVRR